jgi:hypothetical protein
MLPWTALSTRDPGAALNDEKASLMKKRWTIAAITIAACVAALLNAPAANAVALGSSDFLKANGAVLKNNSGAGSTVNLRGTNLGGWLTQEDWMSPLGEYAVDRTGWTASASSGGSTSNAIDGSDTTRWTTGSAQSGAEWLQMDLGAPTLFNRLSVNSTDFAGDYPQQYEVSVSTNGTTWVSVAKATNTADLVMARFPAQVDRYVRIAQLGTATSWWSVGEFNLYSDPVLYNGTSSASASSTGSGTTTGAAIDGNETTYWNSGTAQVPGQTFTIDLGRNKDLDKVLFDSGASAPNDYPRNWDVLGSTDGTNYTEIATGYGTNRTVLADFQGSKTVRYLRLASNGTAANWWTIADVSIYSGTSLDRGGWAVTASSSGAASAIDNDVTTRWTTGTAQASGQWFQIDMGALITVNNVTIDTEKNSTSEQDYARGYKLELSSDGSTWTQVATGVGERKATTIDFTARSARYIRMTLTASSTSWWSIGEITAALYNDDYSLQETMADRFGTSGAQSVIDEHQNTWITTTDLDNLQSMGINFLRVPIGWNTFLNLDGTWKSSPWTKIDWIVSQASARGMYVLLDLHTVPGGDCPWGSCGRVGPNPAGFWGNSTYQSWVEGIWKAIATRYVGNPGVAGYDLINEPLIDYGEDSADVTQKSDVYNTLYNDVRAIDADHVIFLGAFFDYNAIAAPSTYGWTNVVYQLHPYDMPNAKDWTSQDNLVNAQLSALPGKLSSPGVPVLYGEYSLYYNDDVWSKFMAGLNAQNVSWSNWSYKVRGSATDGFSYWGFYYGDPAPVPVINSDDSATYKEKIDRFGTSNFTANTNLIADVTKYAGGLSTYSPSAISTSGWSATASSTGPGATTAGAIDGTSSTRWNSGQAMAGGEWYEIDMGTSHTVSMVTVQTPSNALWDYPRGYTLEVSTNGTTWTTVGTGMAYGWKRPISVTPVSARYVRITQTGVAPQWWSIDEVTIWSSY